MNSSMRVSEGDSRPFSRGVLLRHEIRHTQFTGHPEQDRTVGDEPIPVHDALNQFLLDVNHEQAGSVDRQSGNWHDEKGTDMMGLEQG